MKPDHCFICGVAFAERRRWIKSESTEYSQPLPNTLNIDEKMVRWFCWECWNIRETVTSYVYEASMRLIKAIESYHP